MYTRKKPEFLAFFRVHMFCSNSAYKLGKNSFTDGSGVQTDHPRYAEPTIEEYRAGKYDRTHMGTLFAKVLPFMIIYIPLAMLAIDYAWDKLTGKI